MLIEVMAKIKVCASSDCCGHREVIPIGPAFAVKLEN